jgi:hypothetical protein
VVQPADPRRGVAHTLRTAPLLPKRDRGNLSLREAEDAFADDVVLNLAPDEVFGSHRGEAGLLSTSRKSTAGVSLPAFASYFLDAGSIGLLAEYRCYELGIEILRELMHFAVGDAEDLTVVIVI